MGKGKSALKTKAVAASGPPPDSSDSDSDSESSYSSSSDDTIEDEDGDELTPAMDAAILRTLAKIRNKDGVYDGVNILQTELAAAQERAKERGLDVRETKQAEKPFLLKDMHRENLLAGVDSDQEEDEPLTNFEIQRRAREDAMVAFKAFGDEIEEEEEEGFMKKREKGEKEVMEEDAAYRAFLLEMGGGEKEVRETLGFANAPVTDYREDEEDENEGGTSVEVEEMSEKQKAKLDEKRRKKRAQKDEDFLMDYILNRGWIDREKEVPTYDDIVGHPVAEDEKVPDQPWGALEEEDEFDERAEEFETEYNFRFEEPGSSAILTHPRDIPSAVRRDDDTRKLKREARKEKKKAEKEAREAETRRLKGEQRREMEAQLEAIKQELGGNVDLTALEKVLEGEWDEAEWERVVGELFAAADAEDDDKPTWDDGVGDEYMDDVETFAHGLPAPAGDDDWGVELSDNEDWDAPINMDADFDGVEEPKKKKGKKGKKGKKAEPVDVEDEPKSLAERADKLKAAADTMRSLDHEDEVGGIKTRFKYTKTVPESFGLTAAEILLATDAELNSLVSIKHMQPYRRGGLGIAGRGLGRRVRDLKATLAARKWGEEEEVDPSQSRYHSGPGGANAMPLGQREKPKRLGKKEREKRKAAGAGAEGAEGEGDAEAEGGAEAEPEAAVGKRKREEVESVAEEVESVAEPRAEGEGKKKRRKKKKSAVEA